MELLSADAAAICDAAQTILTVAGVGVLVMMVGVCVMSILVAMKRVK